MKVLLGHLHWGLGTKDRHSDPADKTFLGLCIYFYLFIEIFIYRWYTKVANANKFQQKKKKKI